MTEVEKIISFLTNHIEELRPDAGSGSDPNLPIFELTPRDYLEFSERDLEISNSTHSLVNSVSNLKRAVDCQLDFFLSVFNLDTLYRKKRLGVDRKLGFLSKAGIFSSKSMEKLNKIRNRLEHHYEVPKLEDVEVYFDLVVAFISVVENTTSLAGIFSQCGFKVGDDGYFSVEYKYDGPSIEIECEANGNGHKFISDLSKDNPSVEDIEEFAYFLRVHHLMRKLEEHQASAQYVLKHLTK